MALPGLGSCWAFTLKAHMFFITNAHTAQMHRCQVCLCMLAKNDNICNTSVVLYLCMDYLWDPCRFLYTFLCPFAVYYLRYAVRSFFTMSRISPADGKRAGQKLQRKIAVAVQKVKSPLLFVPPFWNQRNKLSTIILFVLVIKLTRRWEGGFGEGGIIDGEIGKGQIEEGGCE